ncbi:hypothetical protein FOZ62_030307 [Perkinsus olseni]|uniref:Uncharacterized protein n=1 Tax=Perkinsus olseni TaxID=32597 RepID=A0A7J6RJ34_PEROL|nr:hypothetical protein FOZ62_030307 [Perkinsus olseni]
MKWISTISAQLIAVGAPATGEWLVLTPGVYVSDKQLPSGDSVSLRFREDQTLQVRFTTKGGLFPSPELEGRFTGGERYHLEPSSSHFGGDGRRFSGFCRRMNNLLGMNMRFQSFWVSKRGDKLSLGIADEEYPLRWTNGSATEGYSGAADKKSGYSSLKRRASHDGDAPRPLKITATPRAQVNFLAALERVTPLVGNYSGKHTQGCTVGINVEVVGILMAKVQLKPFVNERARSTGVMMLKKDTTASYGCFEVDTYTPKDTAVFTWATKATAFKFVAVPATMKICEATISGMEVVLGGERLVAAVGASVARQKFYLEPGVYVSDDQLPGGHNITVAVAEEQTLQLRVDAKYRVLESPKLESYPVNGGYRGLAQEGGKNGLFRGFCAKLRNLLGVCVVMDSFKLWLREDHFSLEIGGKEYRFPLKETSALRTHAGGAKGVGDSASLKRKAVGDESRSPKVLKSFPIFTPVHLDHLMKELHTFTALVGNYSGKYTGGCTVVKTLYRPASHFDRRNEVEERKAES